MLRPDCIVDADMVPVDRLRRDLEPGDAGKLPVQRFQVLFSLLIGGIYGAELTKTQFGLNIEHIVAKRLRDLRVIRLFDLKPVGEPAIPFELIAGYRRKQGESMKIG